VVTVKVTELKPAGTVTFAGTVADDELLLRATTTPPAGAAPDNFTVPCDGLPPVRLAGFSINEVRRGPEDGDSGGSTLSVAPCVLGPSVARISALVATATGTVVIVKTAVALPAGTAIDGGTLAALSAPLARATERPPVGAGPERVTVP
jgi:hypothetical protein